MSTHATRILCAADPAGSEEPLVELGDDPPARSRLTALAVPVLDPDQELAPAG